MSCVIYARINLWPLLCFPVYLRFASRFFYISTISMKLFCFGLRRTSLIDSPCDLESFFFDISSLLCICPGEFAGVNSISASSVPWSSGIDGSSLKATLLAKCAIASPCGGWYLLPKGWLGASRSPWIWESLSMSTISMAPDWLGSMSDISRSCILC